MQVKIAALEKLVQNVGNEITCIAKHVKNLTQTLHSTSGSESIKITPKMASATATTVQKVKKLECEPSKTIKGHDLGPKIQIYGTQTPKLKNTDAERNKLVIISSNNVNKITNILRNDATLKNWECCHFITPGGDTRNMLQNIENKVSNLTMRDYCVIMIGEEDMQEDSNHQELIQFINETLSPILNTNVILTSPTYICGKLIFNTIVENFNKLLGNNIPFHTVHYSFDSNLDLSLDMFSERTGKLNDSGMTNIVGHIGSFISSRKRLKNCLDKPAQKKISEFFKIKRQTKTQQKKKNDFFKVNAAADPMRTGLIATEQSSDFFRTASSTSCIKI